jgi:hypothetical protein
VQAITTRRSVGTHTLRLLATLRDSTVRRKGDDERREMRQLRRDIAALRRRLHADLDRDAARQVIVATARLLREKTERLEWLESPDAIK